MTTEQKQMKNKKRGMPLDVLLINISMSERADNAIYKTVIAIGIIKIFEIGKN